MKHDETFLWAELRKFLMDSPRKYRQIYALPDDSKVRLQVVPPRKDHADNEDAIDGQ